MRTHKLTVALVTVLTAASIAAPSAGARPIDDPALPVAAHAQPPVGINGGHGPGVSEPVASPSVEAPSSNDFDWGDAAIGAVVALSALGLGAAATSAFRRSRSGHPALS